MEGLYYYIYSQETFTFFEACALALKQILPISKRSMADEFMRSFSSVNQTLGTCKLQIGDSEFINRAGSYILCPKLGYQQLFLAVMRDFPTFMATMVRFIAPIKMKPLSMWYKAMNVSLADTGALCQSLTL